MTQLIFAIFIAGYTPENISDDALWLARSCVGEAGFQSWETGECATIMHIYKKRAPLANETIVSNAKRYSAAIKKGGHHKRPWLFWLDASGRKPRRWYRGSRWQRYKFDWLMTVLLAEFFLLDMVQDPHPSAMHYGSPYDPQPPWTNKIKTSFRNKIYACTTSDGRC